MGGEGGAGWLAALNARKRRFYHSHTLYPDYKQLLGRELEGGRLSPEERRYVEHFDGLLDAECWLVASVAGTTVFALLFAQYRRLKRPLPRRLVCLGLLSGAMGLFSVTLHANLRWLTAPPALAAAAPLRAAGPPDGPPGPPPEL